MTDITKADLRDLLLEVKSMPGVKTSSGSDDQLLRTGTAVTGVANSVIDGFGKLASGTATTGDALGVTTGIISKFGSVGQTAANALQQLGEGALGVVSAMKETSKVGVTMSGDLFRFNEEVKGAHLTIPEFTDVLSRSSRTIAGYGAGMDRAASNFLKVAAEVQSSPIAVDLKAYGMSARELVEVTELSLIGQRGLNAETAKGRQAMRDAAAAAVEMAVELNATAALTGKSRKEQLQAIRDQMEKAEVQASILLKGPEFAKNFAEAQTSIQSLPKSLQSLVTEMATPGGIRTKEGVQTAASLDDKSLAALQSLADEMGTGNKQALAVRSREAEAAVISTVGSKEYLSQVAVNGERVLKMGEIVKDMSPLILAIQAKQQEQLEKTGQSISVQQAREMITSEDINKMKGLVQDPKTGELRTNENAAISRTVNQLDNLGKVAAAGLAKEFTGLSGKVNDFMREGVTQLNQKFKEMATPAGLKATITGGVDTAIKTGAEKLGIKAPEVKPKAGFDVSAPLPPRQFGSLGAVGKLIEDFGKGTPAMLHGREGVITERQLSAIVDQAQTIGATEFSDKINKKTISNPMAEFAEVFEKLTTTAINPKSNSEITALTGLFNDFKTSMASVPKTSAPAIQTAPAPAPESRTVPTPAEQAVLKEVKEELVQLNISVKQLVAHSAETVDLSSKQVRATKGLSGNRFA